VLPPELSPVHRIIRLAPGSRGNESSAKASWRYAPSQCGSWPFLIGDPATSDYIFMLEGQWDALALVSVMGWHLKAWPRIAVVGLRGSTSGARFLLHEINPKAHIFAMADSDDAGAKWFDEGGLLDTLHARARHVTSFWPTTEKCDLNDLVKSGEIDRTELLTHLQPFMTKPKSQRPTFLQWCKDSQAIKPEPLSTAIRYILGDKDKPQGHRPLRTWEGHWRKTLVSA